MAWHYGMWQLWTLEDCAGPLIAAGVWIHMESRKIELVQLPVRKLYTKG